MLRLITPVQAVLFTRAAERLQAIDHVMPTENRRLSLSQASGQACHGVSA